MRIGVPTEVKTNESRVALAPSGAQSLAARRGHEVFIQKGAGLGSGFTDDEYVAAGARILDGADEAWEAAEMILKVKEPVPAEYDRIRRDHLLFTYFHFAADEGLTRAILDSGCVAVAYETVQLDTGELPLLTPMSEVAGRMAVQAGAKYLESFHGGRGLLLGGVPGVSPADVVILGGGVVGTNAARIAAGMGAHVRILDVSLPRLRYLADTLPANVDLIYSNRHNILDAITRADVLIGAVLRAGAKAPLLVTRDDLKFMKKGAVIVDVAVDQGGCVETIRPTTHQDPIYQVEGVIHYGVANMPGSVPRTSTLALTNATFPYAADLARFGWKEAAARDPALRHGLNIVHGEVVHPAVADAFDLALTPLDSILQET